MSEANKKIEVGFAYVHDDNENTVEDLLMKNANLRAQLAAAQATTVVKACFCSYCGLQMQGDQSRQMSDHVKQCSSNPLVQEVKRLRELVQQVEQLHKSLAFANDALNSYAEFYGRAAGLAGLSNDALPSTETDEIILRKIAEHNEAERLRDRVADLEQFAKKVLGDTNDAIENLGHARMSLMIALKGGAK